MRSAAIGAAEVGAPTPHADLMWAAATIDLYITAADVQTTTAQVEQRITTGALLQTLSSLANPMMQAGNLKEIRLASIQEVGAQSTLKSMHVPLSLPQRSSLQLNLAAHDFMCM